MRNPSINAKHNQNKGKANAFKSHQSGDSNNAIFSIFLQLKCLAYEDDYNIAFHLLKTL